MIKLKSGIVFMIVLIEQSTQFSISSEVNSELPSATSSSYSPLAPSLSKQTGCNFKTIGQCFRLPPNELGTCAIEHALSNMDCFIVSNETWHLNDFIAVKKSDDWKMPSETEIESRQEQTPMQMVLSKVNDLVSSRSIEFALPRIFDLIPEGRVKSGFDFAGLSGFGAGTKKRRRRKKFKHHGMMGMVTVVAMMAQLFMGKLAFLAGAALLLSKVSLLFSIVNAMRKYSGVTGVGGVGALGPPDHLIHGGYIGAEGNYPGGGYHSGYQRSINAPQTDWMVTEASGTTITPIAM